MVRSYADQPETPNNQVACECADFWRLWEEVRPLLTKPPAHFRLPGRSRPVVMPETVALEDAMESTVRVVEHCREIVWPLPAWGRRAHLKQHLDPWPQLRNAILIVLPALGATARNG